MILNITKYSIKNILRNKFLTISTILVLTLLMFFINVLQILNGVSDKIISYINEKLTISLYLKDGIVETNPEVYALKENIKEIDSNIKIDYKSSEQNLLEMKQKDPELAKILEDANPFPETIILGNIKIGDYGKVDKAIENQLSIFSNNQIDDEFYSYKTQYKRIDQIANMLTILKTGIEVIIVVFFISIAVITYSVVSNFIYYYKNEIYITSLVGGSKMFIYGPFILQGVIYSIISFVISFSIFGILIKNINFAFGQYFKFELSLYLILIEFLIFIFIGGFSGYFSSRKYLTRKD